MNKKHLFFIVLILTYSNSYSINNNSVDIRGYQFGESFANILQIEAQKKEFRLLSSQTNNALLVYKGFLLNKPTQLFFHFRNQRLSKITYLWDNLTNETLFYNNLCRLLKNKYSFQKTYKINAQQSTIRISHYQQSVTNEQELITPVLSINLENITQTNEIHHLILEFQAFDSDTTIQNKILSEDI